MRDLQEVKLRCKRGAYQCASCMSRIVATLVRSRSGNVEPPLVFSGKWNGSTVVYMRTPQKTLRWDKRGDDGIGE